MAEEDVDLVVPDDDEVVDLTVDGDNWDEIEVAVLLCHARYGILGLSAVLSALGGNRISAIWSKTWKRPPLRTQGRAKTCR